MENSCSWYDVSCGLGWLANEIKLIFVWLYDSILSGMAALFNLIPVPDFLLNISGYEIPAGVAWFAAPMQLEYGLAIIVTAYTARFILRRIPFIG